MPRHLTLLAFIILIILGEEYKDKRIKLFNQLSATKDGSGGTTPLLASELRGGGDE
jgi:hypothetical protein